MQRCKPAVCGVNADFLLQSLQFPDMKLLDFLRLDDVTCRAARCKNSKQSVVIFLTDRIKFVIVAASALDGGTGERIERVTQHFIAINVSCDAAVYLGFRNFNVPDEIPRAGGNEAKPKDAVGRAGEAVESALWVWLLVRWAIRFR